MVLLRDSLSASMTSALEGGGGGGANNGLSKADGRWEDRDEVDVLIDLEDDRYCFRSPTVVLCIAIDCGLSIERCPTGDRL